MCITIPAFIEVSSAINGCQDTMQPADGYFHGKSYETEMVTFLRNYPPPVLMISAPRRLQR